MKQEWNNMVLVAGSAQNAGKTTFICRLLRETKQQKPIAVKISTHFHPETPGLKLLSEDANYQLFEETNRSTTKDSSLFLQNGADRAFYIQVKDEFLPDAFMALLPFLVSSRPVIIESAALHRHVAARFFLFIHAETDKPKPQTEVNLKIADFVIHSDGKSFSILPEQFKFEDTWKFTT